MTIVKLPRGTAAGNESLRFSQEKTQLRSHKIECDDPPKTGGKGDDVFRGQRLISRRIRTLDPPLEEAPPPAAFLMLLKEPTPQKAMAIMVIDKDGRTTLAILDDAGARNMFGGLNSYFARHR